MEIKNYHVEKLCGFYVSDWHLATTVLPYINSKIEENTKVITFLENNIEKNIQILMQKLNLKNKNDILKIRWKNIIDKKYIAIKNILNKEFSNNCIILVSGCNEYISFINTCIEKWLKGSKINNIKIINFFEVTEFNSDIVNILDNHDKILNTSGEREITDVFTGYNNNSKRIINDN